MTTPTLSDRLFLTKRKPHREEVVGAMKKYHKKDIKVTDQYS